MYRFAFAPGILATTLYCLASSSNAATWTAETSVNSQVTVTNNSSLSPAGESDVVAALSPTFSVRAEGGRLRLSGAAALSAVTYLDGTQASSVDPVGRFLARLEAIQDWLFIDGELSATRSLDNPLGPRIDGPSSFNRTTQLTARVSPYIERSFPNDLRLLIRSDNAWTGTRGGSESAPTEYSARHFLRFSLDPRPFGWALEAERRRDDRVDVGAEGASWYDLARLRLRYALGGQVAVGVRGGVERSKLFIDDQSASFAGAELTWRPTERTRLEGFWEDRSFGNASSIAFTHRSPFIAWDLRGSRDLTTFDDSAFSLPATGDLGALLDAALQTRIVDPIERARAVEEFIIRRGLPRSLPGAINLFSNQVVVRTSRSGTMTFIGTRSTLALSGYYQLDETPAGDVFGLPTGDLTGLSQRGAALTYSRRLSSLLTAVVGATWTRTRNGVGTFVTAVPTLSAAQSTQQTYRVQFDRQFSPRMTGFVGARYQFFSADSVDSHEAAVFAGLGQRF